MIKQRQVASLLATAVLAFSGAVSAGNERVIVPKDYDLEAVDGAKVLHDYGDSRLISVSSDQVELIGHTTKVRRQERADWLMFEGREFNTQTGQPRIPTNAAKSNFEGPALHLVQFVGPIKQDWLDELKAAGATPIHYIANNGYLVWASDTARVTIDEMAADGTTIQYSDPYPNFFKLDRNLRSRLEKGEDANAEIPVIIQMVDHPEGGATRSFVEQLSQDQLSDWQSILKYRNGKFTVALRDVERIAARPDIYWVGEILPRELDDEVQNQIIAGNFNGDQSGPAAPGYLAYLQGLGFSTTPEDYPIVNVVDDIVDNGTPNVLDPTFYVMGDDSNASRVITNTLCTAAGPSSGVGGHGHINTSIVGGYDERSGFPFTDLNNYQRGQGVNPYGRMAGTRIFGPSFDLSQCGNTDTGLIQSTQDDGAQISTNSWGCSGCAGSYDDSSQAFDVGVRDADLSEAGNQQLLHIFSAGNSGPSGGTVGTPGNGKNMLTVGASENDRPTDEDGNWTDGCGIGPTGADDAMDVIGFSSRGPAPGSRIKPETIAPGTHIQGTRQTNPAYTSGGTCDNFRPSGQTDFAASSGTSHSAPAVAGLASLVWYWLENDPNIDFIEAMRGSFEPSPALLKAYLINHSTYLSGVGANDDYPSNSQGYGMPNMGIMFDDTPKAVINQEVVFDNSSESWQFIGSAADPSKPVRIMMVYTDAAGAIGVSPQVNDLNLTVETGGDTYLGNNFSGEWSVTGGSVDSLNNYEGVFLPAGVATDLTITVDAFNIAGDGVPNTGDGTDQDFALVCYNCAQEPTFTLSADPTTQGVCAPNDAVYELTIGSILGFNEPVMLGASGHPAGTTVGFGSNPVAPPGTSTFTVSNMGAAAFGSYSIEVEGVSSPSNITKTRELVLDVFTAPAGSPVPTTPADMAVNVPVTPTLTWTAGSQASNNLVEIATDDGFLDIVYSALSSGTSHTVGSPLDSNTTYYWRVTAGNLCGDNVSSTASFQTVALPGDCAVGTVVQQFYFDDMETGAPGWMHSGLQDTWALQSGDVISGSNAWHADDLGSVSDQYLVSPALNIPETGGATTLQFWNKQIIEDGGAGCYDGGFLEVSTNGGGLWTPLENVRMLTDSYDGPLDGGFDNPAAGQDAWCGDPQDWLESIVDVESLAGETVMFRFRLATDSSVSREGWYIDDVSAQRCVVDLIFETDFGETP